MIEVISFPLDGFGFPPVARMGSVTVIDGHPGWRWGETPPALAIPSCELSAHAEPVPGWAVDHLVVATCEFERTLALLAEAGGDVRRVGETRYGSRAGFVLAGVLVEVVEGDDDGLSGLALETQESLETVAARLRENGLDIRGPHEAVQAGRRILSAGRVAVMTPRR